jgi:hypothetical protein
MNRRRFLQGITIPLLSTGCASAGSTHRGRLAGTVHVRPGDAAWPSDGRWNELKRAVGGRLITPRAPTIDQQGCTYHPRVQGARVGQTLEVKNSDATLHNIHSMSTRGNDFNVGQPLAGMVYRYQVKSEEVMLHVRCDVHSWMTGYIGVVNHPYYAISDATGAFTISGVPAGKQTIQAWHEAYGPLTVTVDVKASGTTTADFTYTGTERPTTDGAFAVQEMVVPAGATAVELVAASGTK